MLFELPESLPVLSLLRMQLADLGDEVEIFRSLQKFTKSVDFLLESEALTRKLARA